VGGVPCLNYSRNPGIFKGESGVRPLLNLLYRAISKLSKGLTPSRGPPRGSDGLEQRGQERGVVPGRDVDGQAEADGDEAARGDDRQALALVAEGVESVRGQRRGGGRLAAELLGQLEPPVGAVLEVGGLRRRRRDELDPAIGQDPPSVPDAVLGVKQAEARPVASGREQERGADEGSRGVLLEDRARHAERVEQRAAGPGRIRLLAERAPRDQGEDVRRAAGVLPLGPRLVRE